MRKLKTLMQRIEEDQEPQKAIKNTIRSHEKQHSNVRKRITRIIEQEHSYFITFTLNDKHLHKKQRTHLKKITEALAKVSVIFFMCVRCLSFKCLSSSVNVIKYECSCSIILVIRFLTFECCFSCERIVFLIAFCGSCSSSIRCINVLSFRMFSPPLYLFI